MIHLYGLERGSSPSDSVLASGVSKEAVAANGFEAHAGLVEHSWIMALRPDLVPRGIAQAPSLTGNNVAELIRIAGQPDWPGYFGAPRYATPELGHRLVQADTALDLAFAWSVLDGLVEERQIPRRADRGTRPAAHRSWSPRQSATPRSNGSSENGSRSRASSSSRIGVQHHGAASRFSRGRRSPTPSQRTIAMGTCEDQHLPG